MQLGALYVLSNVGVGFTVFNFVVEILVILIDGTGEFALSKSILVTSLLCIGNVVVGNVVVGNVVVCNVVVGNVVVGSVVVGNVVVGDVVVGGVSKPAICILFIARNTIIIKNIDNIILHVNIFNIVYNFIVCNY
jgi:hypothetical protein